MHDIDLLVTSLVISLSTPVRTVLASVRCSEAVFVMDPTLFHDEYQS